MEITWLGRTCFRLRGRDGVVLTDPCPPASGYRIGKVEADIVTFSRREDPAYSYAEAVKGEAMQLDAPGEYEVGGVLVTGIAMPRPDGTRNVGFIIELDGIRIGHLGLPAAGVKVPALDEFKGVDVLLFPVGGYNSLAAAASADVMQTVDPRIAIPMNYGTEFETLDLEPLERFLKETGAKPEPQPKLTVTRSSLPAELTVVVLQPKP
jgi:L-ascorbate metabolism protein UlaG (beta-lactamase superfamily)